MSATNQIRARIDACRAILGSTREPQGIAWNALTPGFRAALLKVAELPLGYRSSRWEDLRFATQDRIIQAAIASKGLWRFLEAIQPLAGSTGETMQ